MNKSRIPWGWLWISAVVALVVVGVLTRDRWWSSAQSLVSSTIASRKPKSSLDEHDHEGHEHSHEGHAHPHDEPNSIALSRQAMANIGLTPEFLTPIKLQTFQRAI